MILVGWATAGIGQDWTGAAQAPEGGQLLRGHQQGGLLGSLEGGRTGAAATARRAPEGYGVGNMTGAHQAPEGWGQGWTGWKLSWETGRKTVTSTNIYCILLTFLTRGLHHLQLTLLAK